MKPMLVLVDDELQVLNAVERDMRDRFSTDYRIIKANSGSDALATVRQLKQRGDVVALFLVDQRMPYMTGTQFLTEARQVFPEAKKVLLTAYADTEAAIQSINTIGLDHYLLKPWDPPDVNLYPVLDDLLSDWQATADVPYDGIRVAGTLWSASSHEIKDFLSRNQVPYQWQDIETNAEVRQMVEAAGDGHYKLPVVYFSDGTRLIQPSNLELAQKIGLHTSALQPFYDLAIIGAGPAGLGAAVYGGSEGLRTIMIEKQATGGQAGTSSRIENYLGFPKGLSGADLARRATIQARRFGVEILTPREVVGVRSEEPYHFIMLDDGTEISCMALIIATGVTTRRLEAPGVDELTGAGVYYGAALSEAANFRGQDVFVIGGANSAGQAAMWFSRFARKVTIMVRGTGLEKGMSQYLIDELDAVSNIEVLTRVNIVETHGDTILREIVYQDDAGELFTVPAGAMFIFIGAIPHTDMVAQIVARNPAGFILTGQDLMHKNERPTGWKLKRDPFMLETSVPGIFAAGDVRHNAVRRVASAVGEGAIAVSLVHQYLKTVSPTLRE